MTPVTVTGMNATDASLLASGLALAATAFARMTSDEDGDLIVEEHFDATTGTTAWRIVSR